MQRIRGAGLPGFFAPFSVYFLRAENCGVKKYGVFLFCYSAKNTDGGTPLDLCLLDYKRKIYSVRISLYFPALAQHDVGQGCGICLWG
jgi:hypothetical protein